MHTPASHFLKAVKATWVYQRLCLSLGTLFAEQKVGIAPDIESTSSVELRFLYCEEAGRFWFRTSRLPHLNPSSNPPFNESWLR